MLPILGGITGVAFLAYMVLMLLYTRKRAADVEALRLEIAEVKGLLLGLGAGAFPIPRRKGKSRG